MAKALLVDASGILVKSTTRVSFLPIYTPFFYLSTHCFFPFSDKERERNRDSESGMAFVLPSLVARLFFFFVKCCIFKVCLWILFWKLYLVELQF